jgi:hypothetical protein
MPHDRDQSQARGIVAVPKQEVDKAETKLPPAKKGRKKTQNAAQ